VPEPGIPNVKRGIKEPVHAALLAVSGAAKPFTEPLPNFNFSFADAILLSNPHAKKLAIVAPAPGSTPTKKPKTDVLPTTGTISFTSPLDNLIDPSLFKLASDALKLISSFLKIIMNASLSCCSGDMLDNIENNKAAIAYNVLGSYAEKRAGNNNNIVVIYPEDYTHVLLRTAFIPKNSNKINLAGEFLDYILSEKGQLIMESEGDLPSLTNKNIQNQLNAKPIRLDIGLLVYLDNFKKYNFLKEWNDALKYKD
jgi:hypothetical protein